MEKMYASFWGTPLHALLKLEYLDGPGIASLNRVPRSCACRCTPMPTAPAAICTVVPSPP